jgi:PAS domain S-box-containing protein
MRFKIAILMCCSLAALAAEPRRVLLIHSFSGQFAWFETYSGNFRSELVRQSSQPVDIYEVSLETSRSADTAENQEPFVNYLRALFADRRLDLVVTIGGPAARFAKSHRGEIFSSTPVLIAAVDERHLKNSQTRTNEAIAAVRNDPSLAIANILQLLPETTNVFVVIGSSPLESFWLAEMQREFQKFTNRVGFDWSDRLSYAQMLERCATLPPNSAVFYGLLAVDAEGVPHVEERTIHDLHVAANAPMFGLFDSQLGRGIVGGPLLSLETSSRLAATAAVRILKGENPGHIKTPLQTHGSPTYDYRELRRWGIRAELLPANSAVLFREPTLWERYQWRTVVITALVMVDVSLITLLLMNMVKRRRAERALRETEERFRMAANAAPMMIWMTGTDQLCTFLNKRWLEFTGRAFSQEMGNGWIESVHPDDVRQCSKIYTEAFEARDPFVMEYRLRRHDGEYRWISDAGAPREDDQGNFVGYIGTCLDVSESKRKTEALTESENRLQAILDKAVEGIITMHEDGTIQSVNAATEKLFGYTAVEMIGQDFSMLMPAAFHQGQDKYLIRDGRIGELRINGTEREASGRRKDGSVFPIDLAISEIVVSGRRMFTGFVRDMSERKRAEQAARDFGVRLLQAQEGERARLARELHDDITQRLARLAIDAGRIERGVTVGGLCEIIRDLREGLGRLSHDVHSLSYKLHPSVLEDLGLEAALKAECERFSRQESIRTEVKVCELPSTISRDSALCLFRIAQEGLRNVARHARASTAELTLRPLDGGLQLGIRDNGKGFDQGLKPERLSLGLASMRERVRLVSGEINIESANGCGTTIIAWVPINEPRA